MYIKIHKSGNSEVLAVCDEEIMGKTFEEKDLQLKISESFYKGEKKSEMEVLDIIENFDNMNIVGKKSIKLALDNDIITQDSIIYIEGVPHAQIYSA